MKKAVYVSLFIFLGFLLQMLIHAGLEIWYLKLLVKDFARFGFGLTWDDWFLIHHIGAGALIVIGLTFGYWQGRYWWKRIYEKQL